jgi:hypothetical protein
VVAGAQRLSTAMAGALRDELGLTQAQAEAAAQRALGRVIGALDAPTPVS